MNFIKKNWFILLILIVLVIVLYRYYNKTKANASTLEKTQGVVSSIVSTLTPRPTLTSPDSNNNTSTTNQNSNPIKTSGYVIGDKIYAKQNLVNTYKSSTISSSNLDSYVSYNKDSLIGTYLATEGSMIKILISNPAHSAYVISTQVYSK